MYPLRSHVCCSTQEYEAANNNTPQANAVLDTHTGNMLEYMHLALGPDKRVLMRSFANDLGCLVQGVGTRLQKYPNTIFFIKQTAVPKERIFSYI